MKTIDLQAVLADGTYDFDRFFEWKMREGRPVPAIKHGAVQLGASEGYLHHDASVLFLSSTPCLDQARADDFDILCEGDSWACLSIYPGHVTMVQQLSRMGYALCNVAKYGRTMGEVRDRKLEPTGFLTKLRAAQPKAFILSAGANDFIGPTILTWLLQRASGDVDPRNAARYIDRRPFQRIMDSVEADYRDLVADVKSFSRATTLMFHSYTYAVGPTTVTAPFLGQYFSYLGFDPIDPRHRPLIDAIIRLLIDRFHAMLRRVKDDSPVNVEIIDYRTMLQHSDIRDEIHPKPALAPAMAAKYVQPLSRAGVTPRGAAMAVAATPVRATAAKKAGTSKKKAAAAKASGPKKKSASRSTRRASKKAA
jgi:hypothetical protein